MSRILRMGLVAAMLAAAGPLAAPPVAADSRNIRFDRLSLEQGLSQADVHAVLQDRRGFMWFGTQDGLNRFDGYRFEVWRQDPNDRESLSHNWAYALLEDHAGNLWIGTLGGGLNRWHPESRSFSHFRSDPSNPTSLSSDRIRVLFEDSRQRFWIGTEGGGLNRFDPESGTFQRFLHNPAEPDSLGDNRVLGIHEDANGILWVGTDGGGLNRFDPESGAFSSYLRTADNPRGISARRVRAVLEEPAGVLWIGTYEEGLYRYHLESDRVERFANDVRDPSSLSSDRVRSIYRDPQGSIWIATDDGLNLWNPESQSFTRFVNSPGDPNSLSQNRVLSIYQDRGGVLWVGVQGGGLNKWNIRSGFFTTYRNDPADPHSLSSNVITSLAEEPDGTIWVGTYQGLNRRDPKTGRFTSLRHDPYKPGSLKDDRVMSLLVDSKQVLWAGTYEGGLHRYDRTTGRFEQFVHDPTDPHSISGNGITVIRESRDGYLWIGTLDGLNRFDRRTGQFVSYQKDPGNPTSLSGNRVLVVYEDRDGGLWVGTDSDGLNRFDRFSGAFTHYRHDPRNQRSLSSDSIMSLHEDRSGVLWVGTQNGLNRWDPAARAAFQGVFKRYTEADGLPNSAIWGILEDDSGNLWLSTNKGISRFDPRRETFKNFDASHGLQSNEFNSGAYFQGASGRMLFGGNQGFNSFLPERIQDNSYVPPLVLTGFLKFNKPVDLGRMVSDIDLIELDFTDRLVTFEFAALDFTAPEKNQYAYKLDGFDPDWIELGNLRRATYTNLSAGNFTLLVKGANNDGVWSEPTQLAQVVVIPPPWRSWWAYSLYALCLVGLMLIYTRAQASKLRREADYSRKLEEEVRARTSELAERNRELQVAKKKFEEASFTDSLTGIKNRRFLINTIDRDLGLVERFYNDVQASGGELPEMRPDVLFLLFDLDGFKNVNDTYGHAAGDLVLIQVRDLLERACRRSDTLIRWGGDEFLVVCRNADRTAAEGLAERIRRFVSEHEFDVGNGRPTRLSCSIGFAQFPFVPSRPSLLNWEQVVNIADRALYLTKKKGRDGWVGLYATDQLDGIADDDLLQLINETPEILMAEGSLFATSSFRSEPAAAAGA